MLTPELAITYTLRGTEIKIGISNSGLYMTIQRFSSAACPYGQAFLHDTGDEVNKREWRSKERLALQVITGLRDK